MDKDEEVSIKKIKGGWKSVEEVETVRSSCLLFFIEQKAEMLTITEYNGGRDFGRTGKSNW